MDLLQTDSTTFQNIQQTHPTHLRRASNLQMDPSSAPRQFQKRNTRQAQSPKRPTRLCTTCIGRVLAHRSAPRLPTLAAAPNSIAQLTLGHGNRPSWRSRPASLTARAGHAGPRAAATWTAADGGLTSSAATKAPAAAAAVPLVVMASDATAARHSLRVAGVRKSARRRCTCWGTQAMQASTTEAYAWRRYLQRAAFLVVRAGPPSPAVRPGPIHGMGRALYAVRHTPSRDCRAGTAQKQREMPMAEPATRAHCSKIMPRRAQTLPASWGRLPAIVCAPGPTLSWAVQLGRLSWRVDSGEALKTHLGAVE